MADGPIRVLFADDHPVVRAGLAALLSRTAGIDVVGEAATGAEAVERAAALRPHVVVMDLNMPTMSGEAATAALRSTLPEVAVLVLTMEEDDERVLAALQAGAKGYLLKGAEPEHLVRTIEAVARGELVIGPGAAQRLAHYLHAGQTPAATAFPSLSPRERQILSLLARGATNPELARRLDLSPKTVRNHLSNILTKMGAIDRADAILRARAAGLDRVAGP